MRRDATSVDWDQAHALLDRVQRSIEAATNPPASEIARILRERAAVLAAPIADSNATEGQLDLLLFSLAEQRYSVETACILEVLVLGKLTPVPSTPPCILGVINRRGHILPVLDLGRLLGPAGPERAHTGRVIVVEAGGMVFGLVADVVEATFRLDAREMEPPPTPGAAERPTFLRGVTHEGIAVLDLEILARDPRILVNAEA